MPTRPRPDKYDACACGLRKTKLATMCESCRRGSPVTHGHARRGAQSSEYRVWAGIIGRCEDTTNTSYQNYGARGISTCARWRGSFEAFLSDMGQRPSPAHSIDRIDPDGNYEPSNCRWATRREQSNNKRTSARVTIGGETKTLTEWARHAGLHWGTLRWRLHNGWSNDRLIEPTIQQRGAPCH